MKRALLLALVAVIIALCYPALGAADGEEGALFTLINEYRQQNGLAPLALSPALTAAAEFHSQWMADHNCFSHQCPGEPSFGERLSRANYHWQQAAAENIAAGRAEARAIFEGWRGSSGHNRNMLDPRWKAIGISRVYNANTAYGWYWTADFGDFTDAAGSQPVGNELAINETSLPVGEVWKWYDSRVSARGGTPPYRWSARGLPLGMWIDSRSGRVWGRPRSSGSFTVTIQVRDAQGQKAVREFSLLIGKRRAAPGSDAGAAGQGWLGQSIGRAAGREAEGIELRVFDLAGREMVFQQGREVGELLSGFSAGEPESLANGVYLYILTVRRLDGEIESRVGKLALTR
jgi:hypothetical protein